MSQSDPDAPNPVGALLVGLLVGGFILLCGFNFPADELEFDGHSVAANDYCYDFSGDYNESDSNRCSEVANVVSDRSGIRAFFKVVGVGVIVAGLIWAVAEASKPRDGEPGARS